MTTTNVDATFGNRKNTSYVASSTTNSSAVCLIQFFGENYFITMKSEVDAFRYLHIYLHQIFFNKRKAERKHFKIPMEQIKQ